jgi:hypothetical protein
LFTYRKKVKRERKTENNVLQVLLSVKIKIENSKLPDRFSKRTMKFFSSSSAGLLLLVFVQLLSVDTGKSYCSIPVESVTINFGQRRKKKS